MIKRGGRDRAHHAERSAAVDETDSVLGKDPSEGAGTFHEAGICARAGAAIDTDGSNIIHQGHVALQRGGVKRLIRRSKKIYLAISGKSQKNRASRGCTGQLNTLYDGTNTAGKR
jgi:hypothetical protein